jgi:hypothetical protein
MVGQRVGARLAADDADPNRRTWPATGLARKYLSWRELMAHIDLIGKIGLNIDQVSQMTGVKKTTLRYWEKEFSDYLKPERTDSKRRQYTLEEVEKVSVLKQLIEEEKYKSAGVRLKLGLTTATPSPKPGGGKKPEDPEEPDG